MPTSLIRACGPFFMGWIADPTKTIKLNGAFLYCVQFDGLSSCQPRKPNSEHSFSNANKQYFFGSHSKRWATPSHRCQCTVIIQPRWVLQIIQQKGKDPDQWKCNFSGMRMQLKQGNLTFKLPRKGKPWHLPEQAPHRVTSYSNNSPLVLAQTHVSSRITTC